jgi:membrane protein DedA with SNARE-associated domain
VPGVRIVAALMAGAARMPWPKFAAANAAGAVCWASTVAALAMLAGPGGAAVLAAAGLTLGGVTLAAAWWAHRRSLAAVEDPA